MGLQIVACPPPSRTREDDRIVEMFLSVYEQGRFARDPEWLPQHKSNVEVIAQAEDGTKLAVEHTMLCEFDGRVRNPDDDTILGTVGSHMEDIHLPVSDRTFVLSFNPKSLGKLISKHRSVVLRELTSWALSLLPTLHENKEFVISIPVRLPDDDAPVVKVGVEVWPVRTNVPIVVGGYLPPSPDIVALVRKACQNKLPKLAKAEADRRFLMLELATLDSESAVVQAICAVVQEFQEIASIDEIVFARRFDGTVFFRTWNPITYAWSDIFAATA